MLTNKDILRIAMEQSAIDMNCKAEDFLSRENVIVTSAANPQARKYLSLPFDCNFVSYGSNIVASVSGECEESVREYMANTTVEHAFDTPDVFRFNEALKKHGFCIKHMSEYFLPDLDRQKRMLCNFTIRLLPPPEFKGLYLPEWSNALCRKRKHLDVMAVGAYDGETLVGLAGASADCEKMWQIGVDVLPEYRRRGIGSALTSALTFELIRTDKVPFYCAAWCNVKSLKTAVQCGYIPSWVEITIGKSGKR